MTAISWASSVPGDWATQADWSTDSIPGSADDVTINASGTYTVTVLEAEFAHSLTLDATGATLSVTNAWTVGTMLDAASGTLSLGSGGSLNGGKVVAAGATFAFAGGTLNGVTWQGPLTVSGSAASVTMTGVDTLTGAGGSGPGSLTVSGQDDILTITGTLVGTGPLTVNAGAVQIQNGANATIEAASTNTGTFGVHDNTTVTVAGGFSNSGTLDVDSNDNALEDTGEGRSSLTITGTLANTGVVQIGDPILALDAATTVTLGGLANTGTSDSFILDGSTQYAATLDFTSATGFTSNGGTFELTYGGLLALGSSFTNTDTFGIHDNTTLTVAGGFSNSGMLDVDSIGSFYAGTGEGGSSLTITGTLANNGAVQIGDPILALDAATTVTLGGLANTGASDSFIVDGSLKYAATLGFTSPTGFTSNGGTFELTYGGLLALGSSFTNTGTFGIHDNTTLTVAGGFSNSATLDVDSIGNSFEGTGEGGSSLTITGTLANTGAVQIGDPYLDLDAATTVTLGGLANTGASDSFIVDGSSKYAATLGFTSPTGFTSNGGTFELTYGGSLALGSGFTNTGTFGIHDNTTLSVVGAFSNSGMLQVDSNDNSTQGTGEGGSSLTVTGTLANDGAVQIGDPMLALDAATTVTLGALANTGTSDSFIVDGSSKYAATLGFTRPTGFTSNGGTFELTYGGSLSLGSSFTNTGTFGIHDNTSLTVAGSFSNSGTLGVDNNDNPFEGTGEGGSSLTVTGTLANNGVVQVGDPILALDEATTVTLGALANTGTITLFGHASSLVAGVTVAGSATNAGIINVGSYSALDVTSGNDYVQTAGTTTVNGSLIAASIDINGGTLVVGTGGVVNAGTNTVDIGNLGSVIGAGVVEAAIVNNGEITGAGGTLELTGAVSGTGGVALAAGSTLRLDAVAGRGQSFTFGSGTPEDLILGTPGTGFTDAIQELATGDRIEFGNGMTVTSAAVVNDTTIAVNFTSGGSVGVYDLTNVGFANGSDRQFFADFDALTGDSYIQVGTALPVITAGASASYTAGSSSVTLDATLIVGDTGPATLASATVNSSADFLAGDTLSVGDPQSGITSAYDASTGTLTLSGMASLTSYQAELDSVAYSFAGDPTNGGADDSRTISWTIYDGVTTATSSSTLSVSFPSAPADLLLQNSDGQLALWQMGGTTITAGGLVGPDPGSSWFAMATGAFFTGDTSDIAFQNQNGSVALWQVDGTTLNGGAVLNVNPGTSWHIVGSGDFYGDDHSDLLWQNTNGQVAVWEMTGTTISQGGLFAADPGPSWQIEGTGNFYGDGNTDILFQNTSGEVAVWDIANGTSIVQAGLVADPGSSWRITGTGDFYSDGNTDVLLQNNNGAVAIWDIENGTTIVHATVVADPGPSWHVVGTGDFTGGGENDIVLQNESGAVAIWAMSNGTIAAAGGVVNPGTSWAIVGSDTMRFIYSGAANETLTATPTTPEEFVFTAAAAGEHTIAGFSPMQDAIELNGAQFGSFAAVEGATGATAGGALIDLGNGGSLLLVGMSPASLNANNFALT